MANQVGPPDNRCKAIFAMNLSALSTVFMTATWKVIAVEGFSIVDFSLLRNIAALAGGLIWCHMSGLNPLKNFPWDRSNAFFWRCLTGHLYFIFMNAATPLAPISLVMVITQTCPFWISLIAYFALGEPIIALEIISMIVCFMAVIVIASNSDHSQAIV